MTLLKVNQAKVKKARCILGSTGLSVTQQPVHQMGKLFRLLSQSLSLQMQMAEACSSTVAAWWLHCAESGINITWGQQLTER